MESHLRKLQSDRYLQRPPLRGQNQVGKMLARDVILATHYPFWDQGLLFPRVHPKGSYAIPGPVDGSSALEGMYISVDQPTRTIRTIPTAHAYFDGWWEWLCNGTEIRDRERVRGPERWMADRFGITEVTHRWSTQDGVAVGLLPYAGTAGRARIGLHGNGLWEVGDYQLYCRRQRDFRRNPRTNQEFSSLLILTASRSRRRCPVRHRNAHVARHWFGDRIKHLQGGSFDDLEPGEAAVKHVGLGSRRL